MSKSEFLNDLVSKPATRRNFMKTVTASGLTFAGAGLLGSSVLGVATEAFAQSSVTDVDIINFALNLEYLEAEFYSVASTGATLEKRGILSSSAVSGPTLGGHVVSFSTQDSVAFLASAIMRDEIHHVQFLRAALGTAAVKKPEINLDALGFGFGSDRDFLLLSRAFEDTGVSAYGGAAGLIQNKTFLEAAARIAETESQHSGAIRIKVINRGAHSPPVDGKDVSPSPNTVFFVDSQGLAIPRTAREVLNIVYHGGAHSGGFFPKGLNGNIR
jgi:hypothetical protein